MNFQTQILNDRHMLVEGSMYDRLKRMAGDKFDVDLERLGLIASESGREALRASYSAYIEPGEK